MTQTSNYGLYKPELTDVADIEQINPNWDKIDEELKSQDDNQVSKVASGKVIAVDNSANLPLVDMHIYGKSTQDGTPTPDAPIDIVSIGEDGEIYIGIYGKNLLSMGSVTVENHQYIKLPSILPAGQYTFSANVVSDDTDSDYSAIVFTNGVNTVAYIPLKRGNVTYTFSATSSIDAIDFCAAYNYSQGEGDTATWSNIQLELGGVATDYEPCKNTQTLPLSTLDVLRGIPVANGGNYTDENGQKWICDEIDFGRGVYVQRVKYAPVGTTGYLIDLSNGNKGLVVVPPYKIYENGVGLLCTHARFERERTFISGTCYENAGNIVICGTSTDTLDTLNTKYANATLGYVLETPIETPISSTELATYAQLVTNNPNTTVLNDSSANMSVEYYTAKKEKAVKHIATGFGRFGEVLFEDEDGVAEEGVIEFDAGNYSTFAVTMENSNTKTTAICCRYSYHSDIPSIDEDDIFWRGLGSKGKNAFVKIDIKNNKVISAKESSTADFSSNVVNYKITKIVGIL